MILFFIISFFIVAILFFRASLITLGYYKEPVLTAFQQYGDEVNFSPLLETVLWGILLGYMFFVALVPSSSLIMLGVVMFVVFVSLYWQLKDNINNRPDVFLQYPRWYREIVDHTSREERRKLSYMWLVLPFRTRLLYNTRQDAFHKWVELVMLSVA